MGKKKIQLKEEDRNNADCSGYLIKQGYNYKSWKRRFFILCGNKVFYQREKGDINCKGVFELEPSSSVKVVSPIEFVIITTKRPYPIMADNKNDSNMWIIALNKNLEKIRGTKIEVVTNGSTQSATITLTNNNNNNNNNTNNNSNNNNNQTFVYTPYVQQPISLTSSQQVPPGQQGQKGTIQGHNRTPSSGQVGWKFLLPNGLSFMNATGGEVVVRIINARNLVTSTVEGLGQDSREVYVVIKSMGLDGKILETSVVENNLNPRWDESFNVPIENVLSDILIIEVHDAKTKEMIGFVGIDVFLLPLGMEVVTCEQLSYVPHGDLQIGLTALNFGVQYYSLPNYPMMYMSWRQSLPGTSKKGLEKSKNISASPKQTRPLKSSSKQEGPFSKGKSTFDQYQIRNGWLKIKKEKVQSTPQKALLPPSTIVENNNPELIDESSSDSSSSDDEPLQQQITKSIETISLEVKDQDMNSSSNENGLKSGGIYTVPQPTIVRKNFINKEIYED